MKLDDIKVGDKVKLGWQSGLGLSTFEILEIFPGNLFPLRVRNHLGGEVFYARLEGVKKVY